MLPFSLMLTEVRQEKAEQMIIATPTWQTQPWYPLMLEMSMQCSLLLTPFPGLLLGLQGNKHSLVQNRKLMLAVWKVTGNPLRWKEFQAMQPLISQSRRPGSITSCKSAWHKWTSWYLRKEIDPFCAPLSKILNYLSILFDEGLLYRTVNAHRSAISAYHNFINGEPIGKHPKICPLLTGIFNERQPQARYTFIWNVDVVLTYIKNNMSVSSQLSEKNLTCKLTVLLALSSALRASSIQHLNINFMAKTKSCYKFYLNKLDKSWRKCKAPPAFTYQEYTPNESLYVVRTLDEYIARTERWRSAEEHSQLLLSFIYPEKPVVSCTISGWLKTILMKSGIDTSNFKAHSTRSASTSKAGLQGASIEDILKRESWSNKSTWQRFYNKNIVEGG